MKFVANFARPFHPFHDNHCPGMAITVVGNLNIERFPVHNS